MLSADVTVRATRTGSLLRGPDEGDLAFTADYAITNNSDPPVPVTIDP